MATVHDTDSGDSLALERVLFFSDAVFAIAITLLVIEIRVPALPHGAGDRDLGFALLALLPRFVGFLISFFLIGQIWIEHHRIGRLLTGFDLGLLWKNLFLLLFVAFLPFATASSASQEGWGSDRQQWGFLLIPLVARFLDRVPGAHTP